MPVSESWNTYIFAVVLVNIYSMNNNNSIVHKYFLDRYVLMYNNMKQHNITNKIFY